MTIRQVFYRLVGVYGYPKDENAYERLCYALGRSRRAGLVPFSRLRDDGISVIESRHYPDEEAFHRHLRKLANCYERDKLANQRVDIRVLCEAAGMLPQLSTTCDDYSVPVYSCSGFDSLTAKHELARHCAETYTYRGKPTVILHLGDFDPSGVSIYESMEEDVLAFVDKDVPYTPPDRVVHFLRVALVGDQIEDHDLTTYPPKSTDGRSKRWITKGLETCQLEALPPDVLADELRESIESFLDLRQLEKDRKAEAHERRQITKALPSGEG